MIKASGGAAPKDRAAIKGRIEAVRHRNEETGFSVFAVKNSISGEVITCAGVTGPLHVGETAHVEGKVTIHAVYGKQIKISGATITPPETAKDIQAYLASGLIKGIGPKTARLIVNTYGDDALKIIEHDPDHLANIRGIGKSKIAVIKAAWEAHREVSAIMQFLLQRGIGAQRAHAIYKAYKDKPGGAFRVMSENPYQLTNDVRGIGFKLADQIASTLNFAHNDPRRLRAGVHYVLEVETSKGHCGLPVNDFIRLSAELLNTSIRDVEAIIHEEIAEHRIIEDYIGITRCAFTPRMHEAEGIIAERLKLLATTPMNWRSFDVDQAINDVEQATGRNLSNSQKQAIITSLQNKVSIITGGPGVGKTTTLDTLLRIISKHIDPSYIRLAAPAGKAAKRMSVQTGYPAFTIHRLIGMGKRNTVDDGSDPTADLGPDDENSDNPNKDDNLANCKLLVLDESSMIDVRLLQSLLDAVRFEKDKNGERQLRRYMPALIFVGDIDQLPSVGAGAILRDLIDSNTIPVSRLTEIFRQAASSRIITNAHLINSGKLPINAANGQKTDFIFWPYEKPNPKFGEISLTESLSRELVEIATKRMPRSLGLNPNTDVQILAPMKNGDLGTSALNRAMQNALNPLAENDPHYTWNNWDFRINDRVMQITNNYEKGVFNGDQGFIESINLEEKTISVSLDGEPYKYDFDELDQLMPAYAITIHKSQGSEYPAVVIPIVNAHYMMLARNLIYTGVTRGKQMVILIGQIAAVKKAVKNNSQNNRWTRLRQLMELENHQFSSPKPLNRK